MIQYSVNELQLWLITGKLNKNPKQLEKISVSVTFYFNNKKIIVLVKILHLTSLKKSILYFNFLLLHLTEQSYVDDYLEHRQTYLVCQILVYYIVLAVRVWNRVN